MSYLTNYKEIDGGYVAFGGNPKGGKIIRKGTIKTGNLDFENVYFVRELKFNLFSVSQMCDKKNSVLFNDTECIVLSPNFKLIDESQVLLRVPRKNNMYSVDLKNIVPKRGLTCLFAKATSDESKLWHRRLGHLNFKTMNKLVKGNLVRGLPSKLFKNDQTCVACQKGKQHRASCKSKTENSISLPLHLLHMDLFGPTFVKSLMKKMYCLVVTNDYSRFTWVFFLATKDETSGILKSFITGIENIVDHKVKTIRFAERRNRTLIEAARTMLADSKFLTTFWAEAVNTACYVQNRVFVVKPHNKTPYDLFPGRTPTLSFMTPFWYPVTILNTINHLGKFDGKADEESEKFEPYRNHDDITNLFRGSSNIFKQSVVAFNPNEVHSLMVLQSSHDDEFKPSCDNGKKVDEDPRKHSKCNDQEKEDNVNSTNNVNAASTNKVNAVGRKTSIKLPFDPNMPALEDVSIFDFSINDEDDGAEADMNNLDTTIQVSPIPTTRIHKDHPLDQVIGDLQSATQTRKMLKKLEEHGFVRYTQEEGINYDELFAPVARIEAIRLFLAYASFKDFVVYQMDVKSAFLYGKIEEEVYVCQPPGFEDPDFPDRVYKVEKALYGLYQAPRAWYETLSTYLLDNEFQRGKIDKTLFIKRHIGDILLIQVYVDDIIFGSTKKELCNAFEKFTEVKTASAPMETQKPMLKDEDGKEMDVHMYRSMIGSLMYLTSSRPDIMFAVYSPFDLVAYTDSDYAGARLDMKSTIGVQRLLHGMSLVALWYLLLSARTNKEIQLSKSHFRQGRINAIDADEDITLVNIQDDTDKEMYNVVILAQALAALKSVKPKVKGDVIEEPNVPVNVASASTNVSVATTTTTTIPTPRKGIFITELGTPTITRSSQQPSQAEVQDKGKGKMIEPEPLKKMSKKDQLRSDEKEAKRLQAEFDEEERLAREKDEANVALTEEWDDIQAKIEVDHELAQRLQAEEQEELFVKEKAKLFQQLLEQRRKHFAAKSAKEKRNKPPTQAQQRKIMCTYLKNMEGKKLKDLKNKSFDSIQKMFDRAFKRVNTFVDFRTDLVEDKDKDTAELQSLMEVIPDEEEMFLVFSQMLKSVDKEDLVELYKLVKAKYGSTRPVEDMDLLLWGDLKTMFEPHVEDEI
ncbi:retrovirus-related pol polyprotein from transposon TNT 1-94 [Tanacetum coccineum]